MNTKYINLNNRALVNISGPDCKNFLQGLISNDINKISSTQAIYSVMLNPQGRFLYDFFVIAVGDRLVLDCLKDNVKELVKKLSFYKLRSKVEITIAEELKVIAVISDQDLIFSNPHLIHFSDPRSNKMGSRIIASESELSAFIKDNNLELADIDLYNYHRLSLKIADHSDLTYDQSLILEYGFEDLNAIDYNKGCYVGQEVTARTHYRGLVRKKIFLVIIDNLQAIDKGSEIINADKKIGIILSSVFYNQKLFALALIRSVENDGQQIDLANADLMILDNKVNLIS